MAKKQEQVRQYAFVADGGVANLRTRITDPKVVAANGNEDYLSFRPAWARKGVGVLLTDNPVIASWVRKQIKEGFPATEDLSTMPLRCPECDFTTPTNTAADHDTLSVHMADAHPIEDADAADDEEG